MKLQSFGVALALACCGAGAAKADWEYTKWGMSPQEVLAASNNLAKESSDLRPDSKGNVTRLVAPYESGAFSFEAQFGFDAQDKLTSVTLVMNDPSVRMEDFMDMSGMDMEGGESMGSMGGMQMAPGQSMGSMGGMDMGGSDDKSACYALDESLNAEHGEPSYGGAGHLYVIQQWQDAESGDAIDYHALYEVGCYVEYSALESAGGN
jgi:hypothetical protein